MAIEFWIGLIIATVAAFFLGRRSTSKRAEIDTLKAEVTQLTEELETTRAQADVELAAARAQAARVQAGVSTHFEQSAVLFGRLAQGYRDFLEHFSESAQALGISEARAHELLDQIAQPLITHVADRPDEPEDEAAAAAVTEPTAKTPAAPTADPDKAVPTLDPISAKVAEIELEETTSREAPRRAG